MAVSFFRNMMMPMRGMMFRSTLFVALRNFGQAK